MSKIKLNGVCKFYGNQKDGNFVPALDNINLVVEPGEIVAVVGPSGSGKSTLLHMIGGMDRPDHGIICIGDKNIVRLKEEELAIFRRRKIGIVFQSFHLIPVLTVEENVEMPLLLDKKKKDKKYMKELLTSLGLEDRKKHMPSQLSGGQKQRTAIARALANQPGILLADEPTGALDTKNTREVITLLKATAKKFGQTLIIVTHNLEIARECNRIIAMEDGKIISDSTVKLM